MTSLVDASKLFRERLLSCQLRTWMRQFCSTKYIGYAASTLSMASALLMVACGGGSNSSETIATTPASPTITSTKFGAAYSSLVRQSRSFSLRGTTSSGISLTATISVGPGASIVAANGFSYDVSTISFSIFNNGSLINSEIATIWFFPGTTNQAYIFKSSDQSCALTTSGAALPTTASAGQSGPYLAASVYSGCTPATLPRTTSLSFQTRTQTWSLETIDRGLFLCMNTSISVFGSTETESDCFEVIDADGSLGSRAVITTKDTSGITTRFTN